MYSECYSHALLYRHSTTRLICPPGRRSTMTFAVYVSLIIFVAVASVESVSKNDSEHLGCFDRSYALSSKYRTHIKACFTWETCVALCDNKATMYAGMSSIDKECYCGNDIPTYSTKLDDTLCSPCDESSDKMCGGGQPAMSLYRISDHSQALLLAMEDGVKKLTPSDNYSGQKLWSESSVYSLKYNALAIAYDIYRQEIYSVSGNKILRSVYIPVLMEYIPPAIFYEAEDNITSILVNWVYSEIHFCYGNKCFYMGPPFNTIYKRIDFRNLDNIVFRPYDRIGLNFYQKSLTFTNSVYDVFAKYHLTRLIAIAEDTENEKIYAIGSYDNDDVWYIASINYKGRLFMVHYEGPQLSDPFALDVFDNQVVWGNRDDSLYWVYVSKVAPSGDLENITSVFLSLQKVNKIKIYSQDVQRPSLKRLCKELECSHDCVAASRVNVHCKCPANMSLDVDGKTCLENASKTETTDIDELEFIDRLYYSIT